MSEPVVLAPGDVSNLDAVMDVMDDSFDACFGEGWTAPQCAGLMPLPGVWLTIARTGDSAVGFALSRVVVGEAELLLLAVKKQCRRRGIGQKLLDSFIDGARERGANSLHLEVREGNHAIGLYKRAGFSQVGRRKAYYSGRDGQTYDALTLAKAN